MTRGDWDGQFLRFPWINAGSPDDPRWLSFRPDAYTAHTDRLCAVCGEPVEAVMVYLNYAEAPEEGTRPLTSGPGAHPVCAEIAVNDCPHLAEQLHRRGPQTVIAWLWTGPGQAYHHTGPLHEVYDEELALVQEVVPCTRAQLRQLCRDTSALR
ncbi:hypothetical protein [Amycolatopsis magusensis]|uniref:hypothetical protein n=1 Tax=Amycolatopsis magusensis TaxID=882444 RepID=UPI0037B8D2E6